MATGRRGRGEWEEELTQVVFKFTYSIGHLVESGCRTVWQCCVASTHLQREGEEAKLVSNIQLSVCIERYIYIRYM